MPLNHYLTLGRSGLRVSPLCLGTMTFGEDWGWGTSVEESQRILDVFMDRGGNFIDTANMYTKGHSEKIIGDHLGSSKKRDRAVIATKFVGNLYRNDPNGGGANRKAIVQQCEQSLRRLQTDYIDVYNLHWPARYTPQSNWGQSLEYNHEAEEFPYYRDHASFDEIVSAMGKLIQAGKIRGYGSCNGTTLLSLLGCTFAVAEKHAHLACSLHSRARAFSQLTVDTFLCLAC